MLGRMGDVLLSANFISCPWEVVGPRVTPFTANGEVAFLLRQVRLLQRLVLFTAQSGSVQLSSGVAIKSRTGPNH